MDRPCVGVHYPRSVGEFQAWFRTDADCLDYLEWLLAERLRLPTLRPRWWLVAGGWWLSDALPSPRDLTASAAQPGP